MRRRTLDLLFSAGGLVLAGLLFTLGLVLTNNANFANDYVTNQLSQQKITFTPRDKLSDEESKSACVVNYAGKSLTTGKQAECYANDYIGLHVKAVADGKTYAELGVPQFALRDEIAKAKETNDPELPALEKELADLTATRDTLFKGETLRGLLLTSYGFSVFGEKAEQVAAIAYIVSVLMLLLSIAGFAHAFAVSKNEAFASAED